MCGRIRVSIEYVTHEPLAGLLALNWALGRVELILERLKEFLIFLIDVILILVLGDSRAPCLTVPWTVAFCCRTAPFGRA